jgi:Hereditary spastic paraplegia protein strumpellin
MLQAGQLYVLLFYAPEVLHSDGALMRVLVDKHFPVGARQLLQLTSNVKSTRKFKGNVEGKQVLFRMHALVVHALPVVFQAAEQAISTCVHAILAGQLGRSLGSRRLSRPCMGVGKL